MNLSKNMSAICLEVASISRAPSCAILPPTCAFTSYESSVPVPSSASRTSAPPFANPATPPCPSPPIRYDVGGFKSVSCTLPLNRAAIGPIFTEAVAFISCSPVISRLSQPGMHAFKIAGSFSASQTFWRGAGMRRSPVISMGSVSLQCCRTLPAGKRCRNPARPIPDLLQPG